MFLRAIAIDFTAWLMDAAPIAAVLLEKVQGASVANRARNGLLEELVDAA